MVSASQGIVYFKVFRPIISHYVRAAGNSRLANAHVCKKLNVSLEKFPHLIFPAQIPDARPFDLIFFGQRSEGKFYFDSEFFICFLVSSNLRFNGVR